MTERDRNGKRALLTVHVETVDAPDGQGLDLEAWARQYVALVLAIDARERTTELSKAA